MKKLNKSIGGLSPALSLLVCLLLARPVQAAAPADGWVIWQSNRQDARHEIYRAHADGSEVARLTRSGGLLPLWSPDGRWIAFHDDASIGYLMRPDGSELQTLPEGIPWFWMHDNSGLVILAQGFELLDPETMKHSYYFSREAFPQFGNATFHPNAITHDNRYLLVGSSLYELGFTGSNGSFTSSYSAVILDLLHKDKTYFFGTGCWPFSPPAGDLVFHVCGNCPTFPDIYRMSLADLATRSSYTAEVANENANWGHEYNPRVSNDNRWISYMASDGCHEGDSCNYDIWLHELGTAPSERLRVTQDSSFDGYPQIFIGPLWTKTSQSRLLLTPGRITFFAMDGALPTAKTVLVKNSGGGTLGTTVVTPDPSAPWLEVRQDETGTITFGVRSGFITRGILQANVTVAVDGALGSPATISVTLNADDSFPIADASVALDAAEGEAGAPGVDAPSLPPSVDASMVQTDASVSPTPGDTGASNDAPVSPTFADASALKDVSATSSPTDSGEIPKKSGSGDGCGCAVVGLPRAISPLFFLCLALLALRRSRRRA
jgi:hypothetical protein